MEGSPPSIVNLARAPIRKYRNSLISWTGGLIYLLVLNSQTFPERKIKSNPTPLSPSCLTSRHFFSFLSHDLGPRKKHWKNYFLLKNSWDFYYNNSSTFLNGNVVDHNKNVLNIHIKQSLLVYLLGVTDGYYNKLVYFAT